MATQPQTLAASQVKIRFSKSLLAGVREMLALRSMSIENYLLQLAEADTAPVRLQKWRSNFLLPAGRKEKIIETRDGDPRKKLTPAQIQCALFLYDSEGLPINQIARRFGVGHSTIQRILQRREQSTIRVRSAPRPKHGQRWGNGPKPGAQR